MSGNMREAMPQCAAFIDWLREGFGRESIDTAIRQSLKTGYGFNAQENGHGVGNPVNEGVALDLTEIVIRRQTHED